MTIEEIFETENKLDLYKEIEKLHKRNAILYKDLKEYPEAAYASIEKKEELSLNNNRLKTLTNRVALIENEEQRINYNFRILAKKLIPKEQYIELYKLSTKTLSEAKNLINLIN